MQKMKAWIQGSEALKQEQGSRAPDEKYFCWIPGSLLFMRAFGALEPCSYFWFGALDP